MIKINILAMVFGVTDIAQYLIASIGCIYALWQMRNLRYYGGSACNPQRGHMNPNQVVINFFALDFN